MDEFSALSAEYSFEDSAFFVAYSGGVDSSVLLHLLAELAKKQTLMRLFVLHFDHDLQADSAKWRAFCKTISTQYGIEFHSANKGIDFDKEIGLEASASRSRYQWFAETIDAICSEEKFKNGVLMTAHHGDDQAETILMNMLRGTGLKGLRGIAEKRVWPEKNKYRQIILRPLLNFSKQELRKYAKAEHLKWIEDPSNQDDRFRRNDLRQHVMPELKRIRADAVQQMTKLSRRVADAEDLLTELAINDLAVTEQFEFCPLDGSFGLGLAGLRSFSVARQLNAIRCWLGLIGFPAESEMDLLKVLDWSINGANSGAELRRGKRYYRYYQDTLYVMPLEYNVQLLVLEKIFWSDSAKPLPVFQIADMNAGFDLHCSKDSQVFGKSLTITTINDIEGVCLPKGEGHIQAKKCFQAAKVPPWRRSKALFVISEDNRFIELVGGQLQRHLSLQQMLK